VSPSEALKADPRYEADFHVKDNRFAFSPGQLNKMLNPKSLAAFHALGGLEGLEYGLRTDLTAGLSVDEGSLEGYITFEDAAQPQNSKQHNKDRARQGNTDLSTNLPPRDSQFVDRLRVFGCNKLPDRQTMGFFKLLWDAYNDKIIILLTVAAMVSLSLGLYEAFSGGSKVDWIEGVAICVAILIVTVVTAANDWQKERQFVKLNKRVSTPS
jgi:Ca2+-transporting ATPase